MGEIPRGRLGANLGFASSEGQVNSLAHDYHMQEGTSLDPQPPTLDPSELDILEFVGEGAFGEVNT